MKVIYNHQLINAVKEHANRHYEGDNGWDVLVECWTDSDIMECIGGARTAKGAIRKCSKQLNHYHSYRKEIWNA